MGIVVATAVSILAITALAWAATRTRSKSVCPICIGVAGTWLWMAIARHLDGAFDTSMLPILLGGTVVGLAYLLEGRLPAGRSALLWKTLFLPAGFVAAWAFTALHWIVLAASIAVLALLTLAFMTAPRAARAKDSTVVEKLERQMKECC